MLYSRLLKESSFKKFYIPVVFIAPVFNSIFIVVSAYLLAAMVNGVFLKKLTLSSISIYIKLFLLNALIKAVVNFCIEVYIKNTSEEIKENIRQKTFDSLISSNPYKIKREKLGELINLLTETSDMLISYYSQYVPQFIAVFIIPLIICVSAVFIDIWSAVIMIITYPLVILFMILIGSKSKDLNERQWKKLNILSSHFLDMLQGLSTLKVFGRSKLQEEKVFKISENYRKATMEVLKVAFLSALVLELFSTISTAVLAVNLGLRLVYGKIEFLNAFFILILAPDFYLPLRQLGIKFHASLNGRVAIDKIDSYVEKLKYEKNSNKLVKNKEQGIEIQVKKLKFAFEGKDVINDITFKINRGEKVALVGDSGSGKSTLINILSGFIRIENDMVFINTKDINHINREEYLRDIAVVPQFPHIFNGSIEENITMGAKIDHELYSYICDLTKIDFFSDKLEKGDKTIIGEGEEVAVSGGEAQRIAVARAMVKNSSFIILDEPSSALDAETEELFTDLMKDYLKNTTVLISAHRLNTIKAVDKIIVLQQGNIVEAGTKQELLAKKGKYYELIKALETKI